MSERDAEERREEREHGEPPGEIARQQPEPREVARERDDDRLEARLATASGVTRRCPVRQRTDASGSSAPTPRAGRTAPSSRCSREGRCANQHGRRGPDQRGQHAARIAEQRRAAAAECRRRTPATMPANASTTPAHCSARRRSPGTNSDSPSAVRHGAGRGTRPSGPRSYGRARHRSARTPRRTRRRPRSPGASVPSRPASGMRCQRAQAMQEQRRDGRAQRRLHQQRDAGRRELDRDLLESPQRRERDHRRAGDAVSGRRASSAASSRAVAAPRRASRDVSRARRRGIADCGFALLRRRERLGRRDALAGLAMPMRDATILRRRRRDRVADGARRRRVRAFVPIAAVTLRAALAARSAPRVGRASRAVACRRVVPSARSGSRPRPDGIGRDGVRGTAFAAPACGVAFRRRSAGMRPPEHQQLADVLHRRRVERLADRQQRLRARRGRRRTRES